MMSTSSRARRFPTVGLPSAVLDRHRREGVTTEESLGDLFTRMGTRWPWLPAVADGQTRLTYGEALEQVVRAASWLTAAGVRAGDVVTWQLPNWWEAYVLGFAVWHVGAVSNPVMPFFREHELRHVVTQLVPDVVIAPKRFRDFDHLDLMDAVLAATGVSPKAKLVVRGSAPGWTSYDDLTAARARPVPHQADPDDVMLILYTSGTTSVPKGAMHSSRSLLSEARQATSYCGWTFEDTAYGASPLPHMAGMLRGMICPAYVGGAIVLTERWDAELAVREIAEHEVSVCGGATVFLQELTEAYRSARTRPHMKMWSCGGSAVTPEVLYAAEEVGIPSFRLYGMTEMPTVTLGNRLLPLELRAETDGMIAPGVEVGVLGPTGVRLPPGAEGELVARGPERMLGYVDPATNAETLLDDGWLRTGDLGTVGDDGTLQITGRVKDIVNRGGEKVSARELEELLLMHPAVRQAAIVPLRHRRFGEVPAAFLVVEGTNRPGDGELAAFLRAQGLPRQKVPEEWRFVDALPMTPSGKVSKAVLARWLTDGKGE